MSDQLLKNTNPGGERKGLKHSLSGVYEFIDKYCKRTGLWTREMVEEMDKLQRKLPDMKGGEEYDVSGFDGAHHLFKVPLFNPGNWELGIRIVDYMMLSQNLEENGRLKGMTNPYRLVPFFVEPQPITEHIKRKECSPNDIPPPWRRWKGEWDSGKWKGYSAALSGQVKQHWAELEHVDRIVCLALGNLKVGTRIPTSTEPIIKWAPRAFVQHLTACTIRDTLYQCADEQAALTGGKGKQRNKSADLKIIAQDPAYCAHCIKVLKTELDIDAVTHQEGLLAITGNTFVICIAPSGSLVSIVCDISGKSQGPLGMLCDTISTDTTRWDGTKNVDPWLKWDEWDGKSFSKDSEDGNKSDRPTRNMVKYAEKCFKMEFGDHKDCVGLTHKELHSTYRDLPLPADLIKLWKGPNGHERYENSSYRKFGTYEKCLEFTTDIHRRASRANFYDETFHVRKG